MIDKQCKDIPLFPSADWPTFCGFWYKFCSNNVCNQSTETWMGDSCGTRAHHIPDWMWAYYGCESTGPRDDRRRSWSRTNSWPWAHHHQLAWSHFNDNPIHSSMDPILTYPFLCRKWTPNTRPFLVHLCPLKSMRFIFNSLIIKSLVMTLNDN